MEVEVAGHYRVVCEVEALEREARLSMLEGETVLLDRVSIPGLGLHQVDVVLARRLTAGEHRYTLRANGGALRIKSLALQRYEGPALPRFVDISTAAEFDTELTWKYGGPSVADIDGDGDYDFVLNNHDKVPAQVFWNQGNGTVIENEKPLIRWDVHGTAAGDYDRDGDLDIIVAQGGGNGTAPAPPHLFRNDEGEFVEVTQEVGVTQGARGRSVRWIDMDLDGDLDLLMINAGQIIHETGPRNFVYENKGDGSFTYFSSPEIEHADAERILVTDLNGDSYDDLVLFSPLSLWLGDGDLTFTEVSEKMLPKGYQGMKLITAAAPVDYDRDGDLDIYLTRGKVYYELASQSLDFDAIAGTVDLRDDGSEGRRGLTFETEGDLILEEFFHWYRGYDGAYPIYLGREKLTMDTPTEAIVLQPEQATGWPDDRRANGWYVGYLGEGKWQMEWVKDANIFWGMRMSLGGVKTVHTDWAPQNSNVQDVLLRNDGEQFVEVATETNIPKGGNHQGVTVADFNNDGYDDLFVYRFGMLRQRVEDLLLINDQNGHFVQVMSHGAHDWEDPGHGDMGQAFDFDLDGKIDMLNGSDNPGRWYLYGNQTTKLGGFALIHVGYSPVGQVDPLSAVVEIETASGTQKRRVASAGAIHSQSLLNIVHFGLAENQSIDKLTVTWRNGEQIVRTNQVVNQVIKLGL
ncbi:hypothetical protein BFP72_09635 [Reichenbachiella sp. 5M10]|uniref:CRTAC1 family protein n=1 Tax=Reichenbachiella sp. 5M10 TaxID=1889772 RepID=UPI000C5B6198|nr:CRTAC1 family protein [Reichenbachiella sp. 5M10]PIB35635.1 hypothetical protein BFP72_09635 [Reichenbachiella sp. 5M10]